MFVKISEKLVKRNAARESLVEVWTVIFNKQFKNALDILDISKQGTDTHFGQSVSQD